MFEQALQLTFPVTHRRVGHDYFRQLCHRFRGVSPSRAGDLHEVGRPFAGFLASHLAGTDYAWLAELAALEWAVAEAAVAADSSTAPVAALASLAPDQIERARFAFVPSLRRIAASVPVLSVWRANQQDGPATAVDLAAGAEYVIVHRGQQDVTLRAVAAPEYAFIAGLAEGEGLGAALEHSGLPLEDLPAVLGWLFAEEVVASIAATAGS
jgi:hypothetical protein